MDALRVEEPTLRRELWKTVNAPGAGVPDTADVKKQLARAESAPPTVAEHRLLELLIHDRELRREFLPLVEDTDYEDLPTAPIFRALREIDEAGVEVDFESLGARISQEDDPVAADLVPLLLMSEPVRADGEASDDVLAQAESCLITLRLMKVDRRLKELAVEIASAERAGDEARRNELVLENLEWSRLRGALMARHGAAAAGH
jgi:hypothetical protein